MAEKTSVGRIYKGIGGFYYLWADGQSYTCRARGALRHQKISPQVGDLATFHGAQDGQMGFVDDILPRQNCLQRPPIANLEQLFIVACAVDPLADKVLLDRMFLYAAQLGVTACLVINKCDITPPDAAEALEREYAGAAAEVLRVSAHSGEGLEQIRRRLSGKLSCFAGQSAAGKSSLLNALLPGINMETGQVSDRTGRGKHTTRHVELVQLAGGWLADTPGFSALDADVMEPRELHRYYAEFAPYEAQCRYPGCLHRNEPDCAVAAAAARGEIAPGRLERYRQQLIQTEETWRKRYD
ncbi:MAG: ribosome small subunit-dependent GTPase A [Eubacteriales bacterium]|nr:ribosome small subunit-dependent GTPase A [Eubacteriales bacterium]